MNRQEATQKREEISINVQTDNGQIPQNFRTIHKEELSIKATEYGFSSLSAFMRCMIHLGIDTFEHLDPLTIEHDRNDATSGVTIQELVPEGENNAVDMTDEFWECILRDKLLDIVGKNEEINREGYKIYR